MPTPATTPAVPHPNLKGTEPRTRLAGGPFVDTTTTLAQFTTWSKSGVSQGVIIDRLTAFAKRAGYDPVSDTLAMPAAVPSPEKARPAAPKGKRG